MRALVTAAVTAAMIVRALLKTAFVGYEGGYDSTCTTRGYLDRPPGTL